MAYELIVKTETDLYKGRALYEGYIFFDQAASKVIKEKSPQGALLIWLDRQNKKIGFSATTEDDPNIVRCAAENKNKLMAFSMALADKLHRTRGIRLKSFTVVDGEIFLEGVIT